MNTQPENQYAGIDYGLGLSNADKSTGTRYGVISQNSVNPDALSDIFTNGEDIAWKCAIEELKNEHDKAQAELPEDKQEEFDEDAAAEELSMNWESSLNNIRYERDGYILTGCLDSNVFILASPYYTYAQFCSPCVPGAGNLDNAFQQVNPPADCPATTNGENYRHDAEMAGFPKVYCLGHDWFDDNKAPYPVFSVEDSSLVTV
jgi:hypothetical protein